MSSTSFATGGFHGTNYVEETEFGVTPTNPDMKVLRHTSNSLILSKDSIESAELRSDSQISDFRHGNRQVSGGIGFQLSHTDFDDFLAASVRGTWVDEPDGSRTLVAGVTEKSFTIERIFNDIKQYETFTGCKLSTLALSIQPNAMVTGTMDFVGKGVQFTSGPLDPDPIPATGGAPLDGFTGSLMEGGTAVSTVIGIDLNIDNGMTAAFGIGSNEALGVLAKRINITGTLTAYFENMDLLRKFDKEIESSITITLGDGLEKSYIITLPRIKYSSGDNPVDSEDEVTLTMAFQALYDECTGTNIHIKSVPPAPVTPCALVYVGTEINEDPTVPDTFVETIDINLTGGSSLKTFTGLVGQAIPGVSATNVPDGLTVVVSKVDDTTARVRVDGTATTPVTVTVDIEVVFTATSFMSGYCDCPGGTVADSTKTIQLIPV